MLFRAPHLHLNSALLTQKGSEKKKFLKAKNLYETNDGSYFNHNGKACLEKWLHELIINSVEIWMSLLDFDSIRPKMPR